MSYLTLQNAPPDFKKAVISLWFRVPQKSIDAAAAAGDAASNQGGDLPPLSGIVPLVVFGKTGTRQNYKTEGTGRIVSWKAESTGVTTSDGDIPSTRSTTDSADFFCLNGRVVDGPFGCLPAPTFAIITITTEINWNVNGTSTSTVDKAYAGTTTTHSDGAPKTTDPSFIGISGGKLVVHLDTGKMPKVTGVAMDLTGGTPFIQHSGGGSVPKETYTETLYYTAVFGLFDHSTGGPGTGDSQSFDTGENSKTLGSGDYADNSDAVFKNTQAISVNPNFSITADEWHHVLLSIDLKDSASHGLAQKEEFTGYAGHIDGGSKVFIALDNVNYGQTEPYNGNWVSGGTNNDVVPGECLAVSGWRQGSDSMAYDPTLPFDVHQDLPPVGGVPSYSLSSPSVPSGAGPIGLPATPQFVNNVYQVEMAEFQMWTDVTLDTSVESNRHAFIDYKRDSNGKQIADTLEPAKTKKAEERLGKKPTVMLHGSNNWSSGSNTGSSGKDSEGKKLSGGQFKRTGKIDTYKPEPGLGK